MGIIRKHKYFFIFFLISIIPLLNLLNPGLPVSHDGEDHIYRIASFYESLKEGILIPRWSGNLNWGYGHPIFMFLYPLPSYTASFLHLLGFTIIDSYKIILGSSFVISGLFMYLFIKEFLNEKAAFMGGILFLFAPYRFVDLYVRGALGEHVAFIFMPLLLLAILKLSNLKSNNLTSIYLRIFFISLSTAGLILSHNAISIIFFPFVFLFILILFTQSKNLKKLFLVLFSLGTGFLISFFFWFPAFIEGKYTLRDIVTKDIYKDRYVEILDLFYKPWSFGGSNELSVQVGIPHLILTIFSILIFYKYYKKSKINFHIYLLSIFFLFISIFLMTNYSVFIWEKFTTLQKLQFPWRFLSLVVFTTSIIGALSTFYINKKYINYFIITFSLISVLITIPYWHSREYKKIDETKLSQKYEGTTDTGESSPIWSVRSMDGFPKSEILIVEGDGEIKKILNRSIQHKYIISNKERIRVQENTLYFPGWTLFINGIKSPFEFQYPHSRGTITFYLEPGINYVELIFEDTKIRKLSNYISLISAILIIIPIIILIFIKISKLKND